MPNNEIQRRSTDPEIENLLIRIFGDNLVIPEWPIQRGASDDMQNLSGLPLSYFPRPDYAIGPFNVTSVDRDRDLNRILEASRASHFSALIIDLYNRGISIERFNTQNIDRNPRCLMAIEIENVTQSKYKLGSMINAAAIGLFGVVIGSNSEAVRSLSKLVEYWKRLWTLGKTPWSIDNLVIIRRDIFVEILGTHVDS